LIEEVRGAFADVPRVAEHIEAVRADLIESVPMFAAARAEGGEGRGGRSGSGRRVRAL